MATYGKYELNRRGRAMNLYTFIYFSDDTASGVVRVWSSTRALAETARRETEGHSPSAVEQVEVPHRRDDLVRFLNRYAGIA